MKKKVSIIILFILFCGIFLCGQVSSSAGESPESEEGPAACWIPVLSDCIGSDGREYYKDTDYWNILYHADGTTSYHYVSGGTVRRKYQLIDGKGNTQTVYCIGAGLDYRPWGEKYEPGVPGASNPYYQLLPPSAREGISYVLMFGYEDRIASPIPGTNENDYWLATQAILWEYQQGLREGISERKENGKVGADVFYNMLRGRPAEKCYNWILEKIREYLTFPSFVTTAEGLYGSGNINLLVQQETGGPYTAEIYDTNQTGAELVVYDADGNIADWIAVSYLGNYRYRVTADRPVSDICQLTVRKMLSQPARKLLFFSDGNKTTQVMTCRTSELCAPEEFRYMQIRTQTHIGEGNLRIIKSAQAGTVSGIRFRLRGIAKDNKHIDRIVQTDAAGEIWMESLPAGTYEISELLPDGSDWHTPSSQTITVEEGQTVAVYFHNILRTGELYVVKRFEGRETPCPGIPFEIVGVYEGTEVYREVARTDSTGCILLKDLPVGEYVVREIKGPHTEYYLLSDPVRIEIRPGTRSMVEIVNLAQRNRIQIHKIGLHVVGIREEHGVYIPVLEDTALSGACFEIYAAEDICAEDGTVRIPANTFVETITEINGVYISGLLYPGKYRIEEIHSPEGYRNCEIPILVDVYADQEIHEITICNERIPCRVLFLKELEAGRAELYSQVYFGLYTKEPIVMADGSFVPADGLLTVSAAGTDGTVMLETLFSPGDFYVREIQTADGYAADPQSYAVMFSDEAESGYYIGSINNGTPIVNTRIPTIPATGDSDAVLMLFCVVLTAVCVLLRLYAVR